MTRRLAWLAFAWLLLAVTPAEAQVQTPNTVGAGGGGGGTVTQGTAAATTDAAAWPVKVVFGSAQVDPRDVSDRAARQLGKITFDTAQPVTQSGTWSFSFTAPQHIICDSGCGSPAATADNSAFTFGTTSVSPIAFVVDDVSPNSVTENSFGAARMSGSRILYVDVSKSGSNTNSFKVDFGGAAQPVSGPLTDTQLRASAVPVSGTFWQATQPVSASTLPLPSGAATSAKQPALGTAGSASADVLTVQGIASMTPLKVDGSAVTQPVSGTFWQATQPVSGTVTANAGTGTFAVNNTQINGTTMSTAFGVADSGTQRVAVAQELTYGAGMTAATNTAAGTGTFWELCGSASKTIRVQKIVVSGTVATGAKNGDVILTKRSAATTSGTSSSLTVFPYDSNSAAGTATAKFWTVLGTAGTSVGVVQDGMIYLPLTGTGTYTQPIEFVWRDSDAEAPTLRGTAQCLSLNFGTTTTNAPALLVSAKWTEK